MVVLTPAQQHLIKGLKIMRVEEDEMIGIMLLMDTPEKQDQLMMWMSKNQKATPSDILGKAMEISRQYKEFVELDDI